MYVDLIIIVQNIYAKLVSKKSYYIIMRGEALMNIRNADFVKQRVLNIL